MNKCQECGGPTYGDNLICDRCRYTEDDAYDMMDCGPGEADPADDYEINELFGD